MKKSEEKKKLVQELADYYEALNVRLLHVEPNHKTSKDWLGEVGSILKNLNEGGYQEFLRLRKSLYPEVLPFTRKKAAYEIEGFIRGKVAEYKRTDFSYLDRWRVCLSIPKIMPSPWIKNSVGKIIIGVIVTVLGGLVLYYSFGIGK